MSLFSKLTDCGLFISLILLKLLFFFLNRQGLAALSGDVDLVEEKCACPSTRAFLGLSFFKSWWFICFHKAEQWCLLVSRTHTCSLPAPFPPHPSPPHQERQKTSPCFLILGVSKQQALWEYGSLWDSNGNKGTSCRKCIQMHIHNFACDSRWCKVVCVYKLRIWQGSFWGHALEMVATFVGLHWASSLGCTRKGAPQFLTSESCCS